VGEDVSLIGACHLEKRLRTVRFCSGQALADPDRGRAAAVVPGSVLHIGAAVIVLAKDLRS